MKHPRIHTVVMAANPHDYLTSALKCRTFWCRILTHAVIKSRVSLSLDYSGGVPFPLYPRVDTGGVRTAMGVRPFCMTSILTVGGNVNAQ
jgi:hypothetical protein